MQWQPRSTIGAAAGLLRVPEPGAVRAGMRLARARPEHLADLARLHGRDRLQRLRRVDEVLEVAAEDARALDGVEHPLRLLGGARERLRAEDRLAVLRAELDGLLVQLVRQADHDRVGLGMRDRLLEVGRPLRHAVLGAEACARSSERE